MYDGWKTFLASISVWKVGAVDRLRRNKYLAIRFNRLPVKADPSIVGHGRLEPNKADLGT